MPDSLTIGFVEQIIFHSTVGTFLSVFLHYSVHRKKTIVDFTVHMYCRLPIEMGYSVKFVLVIVSLPQGWIQEIKCMYPALLMHGLFLT